MVCWYGFEEVVGRNVNKGIHIGNIKNQVGIKTVHNKIKIRKSRFLTFESEKVMIE